jgi:hypothetical protein
MLLEHGLADELLLIVYPVLLGQGKRFFSEIHLSSHGARSRRAARDHSAARAPLRTRCAASGRSRAAGIVVVSSAQPACYTQDDLMCLRVVTGWLEVIGERAVQIELLTEKAAQAG